MKTFITIVLVLLTAFIAYAISVKGLIEQEPALYLDNNTTIQFIIENDDSPDELKWVRTLKLTYKDYLDKPIKLSNGDKIYNRCSYRSQIIFKAVSDTLAITSMPRMSCEIVAFFNLSKENLDWLATRDVYEFEIHNLTTDLVLVYENKQPDYLNTIINKFNK